MAKSKQTKSQLVAQVEVLRQRVAELEAADAECQQTQAALQVSETRYRRLFETAQDGILILDADTGQITDVNPFLVKMLGYSHAELLGRQLWEIGPFKDIAAARAAFSELQSSGYIRYEDLPLEASDGRHLHVEFVSNVYGVDQRQVIQCNIRDITARQRAEAALSQSLAELQARNADLDAFAHTVAHDLKTPVHLITGYAEALAKYYPTMSEEERQRDLNVIVRSGLKMGQIIDELLLLAELHKSEVETRPLDMAHIVAESVGRLTDDITGTQAEIAWPGAPEWPAALGYGPWVEEVWVNYLSNALKYGSTPLEAPCIELGAAVQPDGMVCYWVRDHGPGITPETQSRLFAPFTHLNQIRPKGHGLGLSIVRRIVEKLNGQVGLTSQVGEGSTFYFTLPVTQ
jgi:PAS domain S-box-containing protein